MKTGYLLHGRGKEKQIYVALYEGEVTRKIYTGQRIPREAWNKKKGQPKDTSGEVYTEIEAVKKKVDLAVTRIRAREEVPTPISVKNEYRELIGEKKEVQKALDQITSTGIQKVKDLAKFYLEHKLEEYTPSTKKAVIESINAFTSYLDAHGLAKLERKQLDQQVIDGYAKYLTKKSLADSTHGKRMKHVKWFLDKMKFKGLEIDVRTGAINKIYLTLEELRKVEKYEAGEHQKAKDMYLLACYTGQRISDIKRLNKFNTANGEITLYIQKTGSKKQIRFAITNAIKEILERNDYHAPKITEQECNRVIREIFKACGITQKVSWNVKKGNKTQTIEVPKYEVLWFHTSKKTFINTVAPKIYEYNPYQTAAACGMAVKTLLSAYYDLPQQDAMEQLRKLTEMKIA